MKKLLNQATLLVLLTITCIFSCKKSSATDTSSQAITVMYAVTWSSPLLQNTSNEITYVNSTGNGVMDNNLSGTSWTKSVTITDASSVPIISAATGILLQQAGTGELKIYINGILKSEATGATVNTGNGYALGLQAHYTNQ